ncbi:hypothetical protein BH11BAC1_BH11BAC1_26080 [soil metagenome]
MKRVQQKRQKKGLSRILESLNKLGEYLEASPTRRKRIVLDAKYPEQFITTRYKEARDAMKVFLVGKKDEDYLLEKKKYFEEKKSETDFQEQDNKLSGEAIQSFLETEMPFTEGTDFIAYTESKLITIQGVEVSIYPDLIVRKSSGGLVTVGAIKLHLSKSNNLSEESQKVIAAIICHYVGLHVASKEEPANNKLCFSFDVFSKDIECSPTSFKTRMQKIEAACEEIALWWGKL